jgi:predicted nucleic acid-binding protein
MDAFLAPLALILPDRALCAVWAEVAYDARRNGRPIQAADGWIAAVVIALGVPLVTHNRDDYAGVDGLLLAPDAAAEGQPPHPG